MIDVKSEDEKKIKTLWEKYTLQVSNPKFDFFESGGDSLSAIKLIVDIQNLFNVEISLEHFMRNPSLDFLYDLVSQSETKYAR